MGKYKTGWKEVGVVHQHVGPESCRCEPGLAIREHRACFTYTRRILTYLPSACICAQLCPTLRSMDCSPLDSSVMEFPRRECWSRLSFPIPGCLPDSGVELTSSVSPALGGGFFTTATWEVEYSLQTQLVIVCNQRDGEEHASLLVSVITNEPT